MIYTSDKLIHICGVHILIGEVIYLSKNSQHKHLNPMLNDNRKKPEYYKLPIQSNVGANNENRKTRTDKKVDITIPLSENEKRLVKTKAHRRKVSQSNLCTDIVKKALLRSYEYKDVEYKDHKDRVHCKLEDDYYQMLVKYAVDWNCSIRQAAHRIFANIMFLEGGRVN
jgi:hypothetical protein